ncbi:MAG: hypothetical protein OXG53_15930 [Chloroflexi bacterium]|nr:hypothetical protein [Chloroflexota bacterium]
MVVAPSAETGPQRRPTLNPDEQRIADAVVAALEPRFSTLSQLLDDKFANHMTEVEGYYAERDRKRDEEFTEIKRDLKKILEALEG